MPLEPPAHAASPLGSAAVLTVAPSAHSSITSPESAFPGPPPQPLSSPLASPLSQMASPEPRHTHLRPTFTLDDAGDSADDLTTSGGGGAPGSSSRRSLRAGRPSSTRSAGKPPGTPASTDGAGLRPRSHLSGRPTLAAGESARPHAADADSRRPTDETSKPAPQSKLQRLWTKVADNHVFPVNWVGPALSKKSNLKILLRCSLSAWIGMLFIIISKTEKMLGQASFFVLVIAFMQPPDKSWVQNAELHFFTILFGAFSWAWVCIAAAISTAVRQNGVSKADVDTALIFSGGYLEARVSIVCAVFLGVGSGFFCWLKVRTAPSPITLPCVLACVQMDVALTLIPLFPYPYYTSGLVFFLPMTIQIGVSLLASTVIFPSSASFSYLGAVSTLLAPLEDSVKVIGDLFDSAGEGEASLNEWIDVGQTIKDLRVKSSTTGLVAMRGLEGSLGMDISWGRIGAKDLQRLGEKAKNVNLRAGGLGFFFDILKSALLHDALDSTAFQVRKTLNQSQADGFTEALSTRPNSVYAHSEHGSRPSSPVHSDDDTSAPPSPASELVKLPTGRTESSGETHVDPPPHSPFGAASPLHKEHDPLGASFHHADHSHATDRSRKRDRKLHFPMLRSRSSHRSSPSHHGSHHHHHKSHGSHISLLEKLRRVQEPVGLFESHRYMHLEHSLSLHEVEQLHHQLQLLAHSCLPLLHALEDSIKHAAAWNVRINADRSFVTRKKSLKRGPALEAENERVVERLRKTIAEFNTTERMEVIEPYKHIFDPTHPAPDDSDLRKLRKLPHRQLFWCFAFQFHVIAFANDLLRLVEEQQTIELKRQKQRLWTPLLAWSRLLPTRSQDESDGQRFGEEDPDRIQGLKPRDDSMNGTQRRDPDSMEPSNAFFALLRQLHRLGGMLSSTQGLFAMKAAILTVLVATPAWTPQTALFFYRNRGLWVIIMAQLTLALYSGETALAFVARVLATFWGCLIGLLIWCIGAPGDTSGNAFGIGAATAVAFPCIFVFRLFSPSPPLTKILFAVSCGLILGYGWQNGHGQQLTNASWGVDVSWRRFVNVMIGISAAWLWSWLPPVSSGKQSIRISYANVIGTLGDGLCSIVSEAGNRHPEGLDEQQRIESNMMAIKGKLISLGARHESMSYEISFRGTWPEERYTALRLTLIDLSSLLSQLQFILSTMDLPWRKALLKRTQLTDPRFIGDVLSVFSLCSTCLRSASPLPQITPCPLIERYLERSAYGLKILAGDYYARTESEDGHGSDSGSHAELHQEKASHHPDGSLPSFLTAATLESEEYMRFAIGCSTVFAIVGRMDKMMVVAKTLLGETYHIQHLSAV